MKVDINSDMGESYGRYTLGNDAGLMPLITSANIACGLHAGDPLVMQQTIQLAVKAGVAVGAHPGHPDLQGFGRRNLDLSPDEVEAFTLYQIGALAGFAKAAGIELSHVKSHGALFHQAASDRVIAASFASAVKKFSPSLILVALAGSLLADMGKEMGLRVVNEGFPERAYNPDGSLMSRKLPGAVIHSPEEAAKNALSLVTNGIQVTSGGQIKKHTVDTLCIHGDSPNALNVAEAVHAALVKAGVKIVPMRDLA